MTKTNNKKAKKYPIKFYDFQKTVFWSKAEYRVMVAGRRIGKSFVAASIALNNCIRVGGTTLIAGKTHSSVKNSFWNIMLDGDPAKKLPPIVHPSLVKARKNKDMEIHLHNGSRIKMTGSENAGNSLRGMSPSPTMIICDEFDSFTPGVFYQVLAPMMADSPKQCFIIMGTPAVARGQLYEAYERGQDPNFPEWESWTWTCLEARPDDMKETVEKARRDMPPNMFAKEYEASFGNITDNVFQGFSVEEPGGNIKLDLLPFQRDEKIHIALDFNVDIMAGSAFALREGPFGQQIEFLQEWQGSANTNEFVKTVRAEYPDRAISVYPDPSGNSRKSSAAIGQTDFTVLQDAGFDVYAHKAAPGIVDSVNCTNAMIMNAEGNRRLFVSPRCKGLISSLLSTRWVDKPTAKDNPKIDKTQNTEHFSDGVRYACEYLFPIMGGRAYILPTGHF